MYKIYFNFEAKKCKVEIALNQKKSLNLSEWTCPKVSAFVFVRGTFAQSRKVMTEFDDEKSFSTLANRSC